MMFKKVFYGIFLYPLTLVLSKEADLPLCPTNVLYFPQNLPMHCRMPTNADFPGLPGPVPIPTIPPFYQSPPPNKLPLPIPIPVPPGVPGPMPGPMPMPMPGPIPVPGPMPLPGGPAHKLPVIVMPFYSPDTSFKNTRRPNFPPRPYRPRKWGIRHRRRRPFFYPSDTSSSIDTSLDTSLSSSSEYRGWWRDRRNNRRFNGPNKMKQRRHSQRKQLLTPVLQYVTKDGYVIFEKKISKNEAKDWMNIKKDENIEVSSRIPPDVEDLESNEPNSNHSREKEIVTEENIELITQRNLHRLKRINSHKKAARKKFIKQQL